MAQSVGKKFEANFKASVPENVMCYRPPDAAQSFNMNNNLRFSAHSLCDFMLYDGNRLFCLELKTVIGSSISFEKTKGEKGTIHYYQINNLKKMAGYKNIISGLIIDFRGSDHTYFLNINNWDTLLSHLNKKSFSETDLLNYASPFLIDKKKLKVNYRYDVQGLLDKLEEKE